jgi:hypothetical protein
VSGLETFADGVVAIAAALLVLSVDGQSGGVFFNAVRFDAARGRRLLREDADPRVVAWI